MTAFRAKTALLASILAIAFTPPAVESVLSGPLPKTGDEPPTIRVFAQNAPIRLGPRRAVQPEPAPDRPAAPDRPRAPAFPSERGGPVQIETLKDIDGDSIGTLDADGGGLGAAMWQGTDRVFVERLVALLPERQPSPVMRSLARRLLLTRAAAPGERNQGPSLLALRIGALFAAGDLDSALALIAAAPVGQIEESLVRTEVEARLFRFDTARACEIVRGPASDYRGLYWQQVGAFCLALSDRSDEAALMSDVLAERSDAVSPSFFAAMEALGGAKPPMVESLAEPSALNLAMMRAANLALPGDVTEKASPAALQAIALSPNAPVELRLGAAEEAAALGVLSPSVLMQVYSAVEFEAADLDQAVSRLDAQWGPRGRALALRAVLAAPSDADRARILQNALSVARAKGGERLTFLAVRPALARITPVADLGWFAPDAVRAAITAGDMDIAAGWIALVGNNDVDADVRAMLWPFAKLIAELDPAAKTPPPSDEAIQRWWQALDRTGSDVVGRARTLFSLFEVLATPVSSGTWALVLDGAQPDDVRPPPAGIRNALRHAVRSSSAGAAVGLAIVAVGPQVPGPDSLPAVEQAILALRAVGLEREARQLALETAVAAGL